MVKLYLYPPKQVLESAVNTFPVCAGDFESIKAAELFWNRFKKNWPEYRIEEIVGHIEPIHGENEIPMKSII